MDLERPPDGLDVGGGLGVPSVRRYPLGPFQYFRFIGGARSATIMSDNLVLGVEATSMDDWAHSSKCGCSPMTFSSFPQEPRPRSARWLGRCAEGSAGRRLTGPGLRDRRSRLRQSTASLALTIRCSPVLSSMSKQTQHRLTVRRRPRICAA